MRPVIIYGLLIFSVLVLAVPSHAEGAGKSRAQTMRESWTVMAYFENDLFYNEDRYYTNAVQLRLISPDLRTFSDNDVLPSLFGNALETVPLPGGEAATQYNISLGFGQHIYTPKDTDVRYLQKNDRPYAGYLYGSLALHAKKSDRLDTLELAAGIVGPSSLAEQSQNEVHRFRGFETANGWDHQLKDEPVAMLTWSRIWRLNAENVVRGFGWDVLPRVAVSAGTPFTQASVGGDIRFGWNLPPDFGSTTIRPGSGIIAPSAKDEQPVGGGFWDNAGVHIFVGVEGRGVLHNTFLDGNTWKDSHSIDKFPFVGEFHWGVACHVYDFIFTFTHVYTSREFHGQDKGHNFGSITLGYVF
ncbi:MAG: hypothetical protein DELT_00773 [Desulfovibrio sp.]